MQLYEPSVFIHVASALQLCVPVAHSSLSVYDTNVFLPVLRCRIRVKTILKTNVIHTV